MTGPERSLTKTRPNEPCWCGSGRKYKRCHRAMDQARSVRAPTRRSDQPERRRIQKGVVGPRRAVPETIPRPDYAETSIPKRHAGRHVVRNDDARERMEKACWAAREVLDTVLAAVRPGITTDELDAIAHEEYLRRGGYPSPLNYHGYPKSLCTSVNEVICHGIPDDTVLETGDIVNCDVTIYLNGVHGDCSETVVVGEADPRTQQLVAVTRECLLRGIETVRPGGKIREIGRAIEAHATRFGYSVVRSFVGHGIGPGFHMDPQVPHYYDAQFRDEIVPGMTFTIEPMINLGTWRHVMWDDDWTAVTADLQLSAQFEHTVLCTDRGVRILTQSPDQEQPFEG